MPEDHLPIIEHTHAHTTNMQVSQLYLTIVFGVVEHSTRTVVQYLDLRWVICVQRSPYNHCVKHHQLTSLHQLTGRELPQHDFAVSATGQDVLGVPGEPDRGYWLSCMCILEGVHAAIADAVPHLCHVRGRRKLGIQLV